ncbi:MAG TPA: alpha/beta hydrolase [Actinomycetes bacterium]
MAVDQSSPLSRRQRLEAGVVQTLAHLPARAQRLLAGPVIEGDYGPLDVQVQLVLRLMAADPRPSFETLPVAQARESIRLEAAQFAGRRPADVIAQQLTVDGAEGPLGARLYLPEGAQRPGPLVVWFHGGGWVVGDLDSHDPCCRFLSHTARLPVLAVDYRLAPEAPFPAAVDDALAAFRWAVRNAAALGADPDRIAVAGDSAGGNLAAVVSLLAALDGGPAPAFQALVYPATDLSRKSESYREYPVGYFLTEAQMDWYRTAYLPDPSLASDPRVSPLLAHEVAGLPPAYVTVGAFDVLRDETVAYARRLTDAGVPTTLRVHPGLIHGFVNAAGVLPVAAAAVRELADALATALHRPA